jgi:hypothetical protein
MNIDMITIIVNVILGLIFICVGYVKMREKKGNIIFITLFIVGIVAVIFNIIKFFLIKS